MDSDGDSDDTTTAPEQEASSTGEPSSTSSSPKVPAFRSIGHPAVPTHEQLQSNPGSDAYPKVAKVEGLMDGSESPMKM
jgi:protein phosphatase 2C family protein 2/3